MKSHHIAAVLAEITEGPAGTKYARVLAGNVWMEGVLERHSGGALVKLSPRGAEPAIFIDVEHIVAIQEA